MKFLSLLALLAGAAIANAQTIATGKPFKIIPTGVFTRCAWLTPDNAVSFGALSPEGDLRNCISGKTSFKLTDGGVLSLNGQRMTAATMYGGVVLRPASATENVPRFRLNANNQLEIANSGSKTCVGSDGGVLFIKPCGKVEVTLVSTN